MTAHLRTLEREGFVEEYGAAHSTGGRRPVILRFRPRARYLLAADVRPGLVRTALTDLDTQPLAEHTVRLNRRTSGTELLRILRAGFESVTTEGGAERVRIAGAGISLPGTVHPERLVMEFAPNLGLRNLSFRELEERLEVPVVLENEANAAALAEFHLGGHGTLRHLLYVSVIQGIGVGILLDGRLYRGANGNAGEFGHMTYVPGGRQCSCGRRGCWERYASERALPMEYHRQGGRGELRSFHDLTRMIDRGDEAAGPTLRAIIANLGVGLTSLAAGFDPDLLVVGGGIVEFRDAAEDQLKQLSGLPVRFSSLGDSAALKGAALLPRSLVFRSAFRQPLF